MIEVDPKRAPAEPRDAATVLVLRDAAGGGFEVFMVRRHGKSGFMAGAHVFPGGKLDDADRDPALLTRALGRSAEECAAALGEDDAPTAAGLFAAAIRETFEEAWVLLAEGVEPAERPALHAAREALQRGERTLLSVAEELDLRPRFDALVPQARWITPVVEPRRYDTRFFLADAPPAQEAAHDRRETTAGEWLGPGAALDAEREGRISLPPPTYRTLQWLAEFDTADAALAAARERTPPTLQPVFHDPGDGAFVLALPGDPLHPVSEPAFAGPTRFVLEKGRWWARDGR